MTFPFCNQADIRTTSPRRYREVRHWDEENHELTQIRTGAYQCPECGLYWPLIEEPDAWRLNEETGRWDAVDWWGGVVCEECGLLMIDQPDGTGEVYRL